MEPLLYMKLYRIDSVADTDPDFMGVGSKSEVIEIDTNKKRKITEKLVQFYVCWLVCKIHYYNIYYYVMIYEPEG